MDRRDDGKCVVEALEGRTLLAGLDASFGEAGLVGLDLEGEFASTKDMAVLEGGGIIVVSAATLSRGQTPRSEWAVLERRHSDGTLDRTFGRKGRRYVRLRGYANHVALVVQEDEAILIGGWIAGSARRRNGSNFAIMRFTAEGDLDRGFGEGGWVITDFDGRNDWVNDIAVGDGRIVALGMSVDKAEGNFVPGGPLLVGGAGAESIAVARYRMDGSLDNSFGEAGKRRFGFGTERERASRVLVQANGGIVVAGLTMSDPFMWPSSSSGVLARLNPAGELDRAFRGDDTLFSPIGDMALTADEGIVAVGVRVAGEVDPAFYVWANRLNADGSGVGGSSTDYVHGLKYMRSVALAGDGTIYATGGIATTKAANGSWQHKFALARFTAVGEVDRTFGENGLAMMHVGKGEWSDTGISLAVLRDGKVLVLGGRYLMRFEAVSSEPVELREDGTLVVRGTDGNDRIVIDRRDAKGGRVVVRYNGTTSAFEQSRVREVLVDAGSGVDRVVLRRMLVNARVFGGDGDDLLVGSDGNDSIYGDRGHDVIMGENGNDLLMAGSVTDFHRRAWGGDDDRDGLWGGAGDDEFVVSPMDGQDHVHGGAGSNVVREAP